MARLPWVSAGIMALDYVEVDRVWPSAIRHPWATHWASTPPWLLAKSSMPSAGG